jgi:hypothetical protein
MARFRVDSSPDVALRKKRKMGRLVKAFSKDDNGDGSQPDEDQFLRESGALAARIRLELQAEVDLDQQRLASDPPANVRGRTLHESSAQGADRRQLGRDVYSELDGEWVRQSDSLAVEGVGQDGLRIFTGPDEGHPSMETSESNASAAAIRTELMEELAQEQRRWTERHAMQVRSIEEQARQLAQGDAEIELREQELDRRERELDAKAREVAAKAETEVRSQISRGWESTQKEMTRLAAEVRVHADRASQFEAELTEVRREHAIELDAVRSQLSLHDNSRADRAKSVIDECDQRMAELTAQRAAWQAEQSRRREELARERLGQRDEFRQQSEKQQIEVAAQRKEFENERDATIVRLDRERREWNEKFTREQDELLDLKRAVESEVERVRADLAREKSEWETHQEHMRNALRAEQASAQQLLNTRMNDAERLKDEHTAKFETLNNEFESERAAWHRERGQEAAILQAERSDLETEADRLRAERSLIETERQQLTGDLERQRAEHDESLRESWRSHQASLQQAEQESTNRQRVLSENHQQKQNELAARMQQAEHEIRSARELCAKQIAQDKERFSQTYATHEAELERARAELNVQRQRLEREKLDFNDQMSRTRKQTEQERSVIRNSLSQMDAQLRAAATSLLPEISSVAASYEPVEVAVPVPQASEAVALDLELGADFNSRDEVVSHADEPVDEQPLVDDQEAVDEPVVDDAFVEQRAVVDVDAVAWEPGRNATLVEAPSSDLIRRFDMPSETGGVSGLQCRPRIASHGVLARAAADANTAEIVYDSRDREPEWVGTVETQTDAASSQIEGRRQALETYRSKLSSLQDQLRQLSGPPTDEFEDDSSADESI